MKTAQHVGEIYVSPLQSHVVYSVKPDLENGPWIAGGACRRLLNEQIVRSDFDIYFKNKKQVDEVGNRLLNTGYTLHLETKNAITYRACMENANQEIDIQLIRKRFFKSVDEICQSFDFAQSQLVTDGYDVFGNPRWFEEELIIDNYKPDSILKRLVKYYSYGYKIKPGQLSDLASDPDLNYDFSQDDY